MGKNHDQLSIEERTMIQTQLEMGIEPAAIAKSINRSASTVSRELRRKPCAAQNTSRPLGDRQWRGYRAEAAHRRAHACTIKPRVEQRLKPETALWDSVMHYLKAGYSPEQVAGTLALVHPDTHTLQVSHETIYTAIYAMPRGKLRTEVIGRLLWLCQTPSPRARRRPAWPAS